MPPAPTIFISVAEPSADTNAALVVTELKTLNPAIQIKALGGPALRAAGAEIFADTVTNAAMGLAAFSRIAEVRALLKKVDQEWTTHRPDLVLCCDSWSMNNNFAKLAKSKGIPVLYYIAPQAWASRESRVKKLKKIATHLAVILPFEQKFFADRGIPTTYVGHPLFDRLHTQHREKGSQAFFANHPTLAILPGSRKSVTKQNWPRLLEVMHTIQRERPDTHFKIPLTPNAAPIIRASTLPPHTELSEDIDAILPQCDLALCVSGTAALHVAAHRVPLLVVYYGNPLLWHLLARWIVTTRTYSLINLLAGKEGPDTISQGDTIAPEYIPWYGPTQPLADHALRLLNSPTDLAQMRHNLSQVIDTISTPGASQKVAQLALSLLKRP